MNLNLIPHTPEPNQPARLKKPTSGRLFGCAFVLLATFGGCATQDGGTLQSTEATSVQASQALKLQSVTVKWAENPDFEIKLHRTMPAIMTNLALTFYDVKMPGAIVPIGQSATQEFAPQPQQKELAEKYIGGVLGHFRSS